MEDSSAPPVVPALDDHLTGPFGGVVVEHGHHEALVARLDRQRPFRVQLAQREVQRLVPSGAVDGRPRGDRPQVVELPHDRPAGVRPVRPPVLDPGADRPDLIELGQEVPGLHTRRRTEVRGQPAGELAVAVLGLLVVQHARGARRHRLVGDRVAQGGPGRRRLPAELGHEPRRRVAVVQVVLAVPDLPRVVGPVLGVVRFVLPRAGPRAARLVGPGRVELGDDGRQGFQIKAFTPGTVALPRVGEQPQVLVVAAPGDQARVRSQPGDVVPGLGHHLGVERLLLRVAGAGEQEVLPHHQPELVAQLVERAVLVDAAAPHPDQVHADRSRLAQPQLVAGPGHPGREDVVGDPVDALGQHRLAVDLDDEAVAGQVDPGGAEARAPLPPVDLQAVGGQHHGQVVERLRAIAARGPLRDAGHVDRRADGRVDHGDLVAVQQDLGPQLAALAGGRPLHLDGEIQMAAFGVPGRQGTDGGKPGDTPAFQPYGSPDARRDQRGSPVPAERTGHLADVVERLRVRVGPLTELVTDPLGLGVGRGEPDGQRPRGGVDPAGHVEPVGAVHVAGRADRRAVQLDVGHRVEALEDQVDPFRRHPGPGDVALIDPVGAAHPGDGLLVVVEERILEPAGGHQVGVHAPRYDSGDVALQRPGTAQVFGDGHRFLISWRRR